MSEGPETPAQSCTKVPEALMRGEEPSVVTYRNEPGVGDAKYAQSQAPDVHEPDGL
jgi:hypothetical protein